MSMARIYLLLLPAATLLAASQSQKNSSPPKLPYDLDQYKRWHLVNPEPQYITSAADELCRSVTARASGPHANTFISVFVNSVGKNAMATGGKFPEKSVIVKQKQHMNVRDSKMQPGIATVMIKREKGFNPDCGDWEFAVLDTNKTTFLNRGKLANCMSCHRGQAKEDFTFRTYLSMSKSRSGQR